MYEGIQAAWQEEDGLLRMLKFEPSTGKSPGQYTHYECVLDDGWQRQEVFLAGKKHPEMRQHPASCFLTHSLLLHGGLSHKQKALGDFFIL